MLVVAFKELSTSAAEDKWQIGWQGMSCRSTHMMASQCCVVFPAIHMVGTCGFVFHFTCKHFYTSAGSADQ